MRLEGEARHDSEVAAATAPAGPEEVAVLRRVAGEELSRGGDDLQAFDVVAGQAERTRREADAAAERQARDADCRAGAGRDRYAVRIELRVDVDQLRAGADHGALPAGGDVDLAQAADVDDHAGRRRVAAVAVPTRAGDDMDAVLAGPEQRLLDVAGVRAVDDGVGVDRVEARTLGQARVSVRRATGDDDGAVDAPGQRFQPRIGRRSRREPLGPRGRCEDGAGGNAGQSEELAPVHRPRLAQPGPMPLRFSVSEMSLRGI